MNLGIKRNTKLYLKYISAILKSTMQYKLSFLLMLMGRFIVAFNGFIAIYFLFTRFSQMNGYTYGEILLCFSTIQMSFSISECVGCGFMAFAGIIKRGEFDRMLLRPCSLVLQVIGTRFEIGRIGPMITAVIMLIVGVRNSQIVWGFWKVSALILMIIGGVFLFLGIFMLGATVCFFSIEDTSFTNILTYGAKEHGKYPIDIYGKGIMRVCTYIIPYTLIQYYPLQYVLGKTDRWQYGFYPFGIIMFLLLCYGFWRIGLKNYKSSGS